MCARFQYRSVVLAFAYAVFTARPAGAQGQNAAIKISGASGNSVDTQSLELQLGEQRVISSDNVRSYSEGTRGVVDVRLTKDASQFIVVALAPGATTLLFLMMDGSERHFRITVTDPNGRSRQRFNDGAVEARDNIRLDFYFVQVSKNYRHQIGLGWPGSVAAKLTATYDLHAGALESATAVISDQALPRLDMAQVSGWAKVMRQAAVVTANGEKASFSGGGEFNFPIQSALTTGLQKIPYGSLIEVEPHYDPKSGRIELRLHADISELDSDNGTGVPGRITSALDTAINLELGQSLILAGLTARSVRRSKAGLPVLSQIPILGVFFGSHAQTQEETENVVLIVPSVVDAVSMQDRVRLSAALRQYTEFSGDLNEIDFIPSATSQDRSAIAPRKP